MKKIISTSIAILAIGILLTSCSGSEQSKAIDVQKKAMASLKQHMPGSIPTSIDGYSMKAKLNGKDWEAVAMIPPALAGRIIGYNNGEYIGLPYNKNYFVVGKKVPCSEINGVDLGTNDDIGMWGGRKGEMEITKVGAGFVEGKFFFTADTKRATKTVEVTKGFFRLPLPKDN